jgi:hypothetical protein
MRRRVAAASVTASVAVSLFSVGAPSASADDCPTTVTALGDGRFEVRFTNTDVCNWTVPDGITKLEALLVGSGGGSVESYAGGGGEVVLVDLTGTTGALAIEVGDSNADVFDRTDIDTTVTTDSQNVEAIGGFTGGTDANNECGGFSGNGNSGWCDYLGQDGGGGAGGDAPGTPGAGSSFGDGGPGVVVGDIAAAGSLFAGSTECFGGGGASASLDLRFQDSLFQVFEFDSAEPGCGGGYATSSATLPTLTEDFVATLVTPANTGGGAGASRFGLNVAENAGSDGLVVVRYQTPTPAPEPGPTPGPDPTPEPTPEPSPEPELASETTGRATLPATGLTSGETAGLGLLLTGIGLGAVATGRRLRPTRS